MVAVLDPSPSLALFIGTVTAVAVTILSQIV